MKFIFGAQTLYEANESAGTYREDCLNCLSTVHVGQSLLTTRAPSTGAVKLVL